MKAACVVLCVALLSCGREPRRSYLVLATTTSVQNSGLLEVLLEAVRGPEVRVSLAGSGRALQMMAQRQADIVISHAPGAEAKMLAAHPRWVYRKFMFNHFILVGPPADPAFVAGAASARDAMRRIADAGARFISRGDQSGTHEREQQLWWLGGVSPTSGFVVAAGSGMGTTLRIASEMSAYTLTDTASFAQLAPQIRLAPLFRSDRELVNTYAAVVATERDLGAREAALRLAEWLTDGPGRKVIEAYRIRGEPAFFVWPADRPRGTPDALPASAPP